MWGEVGGPGQSPQARNRKTPRELWARAPVWGSEERPCAEVREESWSLWPCQPRRALGTRLGPDWGCRTVGAARHTAGLTTDAGDPV